MGVLSLDGESCHCHKRGGGLCREGICREDQGPTVVAEVELVDEVTDHV